VHEHSRARRLNQPTAVAALGQHLRALNARFTPTDEHLLQCSTALEWMGLWIQNLLRHTETQHSIGTDDFKNSMDEQKERGRLQLAVAIDLHWIPVIP
jgi:hypothetical protein